VRLPNWLTLQRTGLFLFLTVGILLLIYALGFITGVYLFFAYGNKELAAFYQAMQEINADLLRKAIAIIIFACVLFMLELRRHAAGKITLVLVALISAAGIFLAADALAALAAARESYAALDLSSLNRYIQRGAIKYQYSTLVYDLGLLGYGLFLCSVLFLAIVVVRNAFVVREEQNKEEK